MSDEHNRRTATNPLVRNADRGSEGQEDRSRQRLGRGLASLIGGSGDGPARPVPGFERGGRSAQTRSEAPSVAPEYTIAIDRIQPNPANPRSAFDDTDLAELSNSIRQHGVVQPLLIRPQPGREGRFELVAGERRWRAARLAGLTQVPVVLREIDDRQSLEIAIIENVQRADLNAIDEALGYQRLIEEHGYTQADLASVLAKSRSHVANTLRLLKLPEAVRSMVADGLLTPGAARTVVNASDPVAVARMIVAEGLNVRQAEELARRDGADAPASGSPAIDGDASGADDGSTERSGDPKAGARKASAAGKGPRDDALGADLSKALSMPVSVSGTAESGTIRIDYRSAADRQKVIERLQRGA